MKAKIKPVKTLVCIALVMTIAVGCNKSSSSNESDHPTKTYDSIEETNDWYRDGHETKPLKLAKVDGKTGFLYANNEELFPCIFDSVASVDNDRYFAGSYNGNYYAMVMQEGKWGLITIDGKIAVPCMYDEIYAFDYKKTNRMESPYLDYWDYDGGKTAVVKKDGKWGFIDTKGEIVADCIYEDIFIPSVRLFYEDIATVKKDGLWGFLSNKGKPITSFIYEEVGSMHQENQYTETFSNGICVVKKDGKWGTIDANGNEKIPFIYDSISSFSGESAIAQQDGQWGYINKKGEIVIPIIYDDIKWFEGKLCPAKKEGLWGFLDEKGENRIPMMYDDILVFERISTDEGLWFFSQDGYCAVKKTGKWGLIDKDNNTVINFEFDGIKFTSNGTEDWRYLFDGFVSVRKGKFWSVVNKEGFNYIPFQYEDVEICPKGNVCVKKDGKWGLLDSLGKQLVPIEHKYAMDAKVKAV